MQATVLVVFGDSFVVVMHGGPMETPAKNHVACS